jgi:hypothetical protein
MIVTHRWYWGERIMQLFLMMANQLSGQAALMVLHGVIHLYGDSGHLQVADILKDISIPALSCTS